MTAMQKDLEVAKSLVQTSSKQNQEHLNKITSLSEKKSMLREKIAKSGKMSLSMKDSTPSEQPEAVFNVEFYWQLNVRSEVCSGSCHPSDAMSWNREIEAAQSIDDQKTFHSITENQCTFFEMLDAKRATALKKILSITSFKKKVYLEEQKTKKVDRFLRERQIAYMIHECHSAENDCGYFQEFITFVLISFFYSRNGFRISENRQ